MTLSSASDVETLVELSDRRIEIAAVLARRPLPPGHGAEVIFSGVVRDLNQGRAVIGVSYDAHERLAAAVLAEIAAEARARFGGGLRVAVVHRVGRLAVGEASVVVVTSAPHRGEAYAASRYVIDELKTRAPIWKQEHYIDGQSDWLPGHALCQEGHP